MRTKRERNRRKPQGFTLVELMVAVSVIGVLSAIAIPSMLRSRMAANEVAAIGSLRAISEAQAVYKRTDWDKDGFLEYAQDPSMLYQQWDWSGQPAQTVALVDDAVGKSYIWGWGQWWTNQPHANKGYYVTAANYYYSDPQTWNWKNPYMWGYRNNGTWWSGFARHGACAFPESYGMTGQNIFLINDKGEIFQKDGYWEMSPEGGWYPYFYGYSWQFDGNMKGYDWISVE